MSLDPILWALKDAPVADVYERAVLSILSEAADDDGCHAFLSVPTIAQRARCSERKVTQTFTALVARGLLALGDQQAAAYIPAQYRPTVYEMLIPLDWFPNPGRINEYRARRGRPPLTAADRPPIMAPADRPRRADYGKPKPPRPAGLSARGDYQSPLADPQVNEGGLVVTPVDNPPGVTTSTARGDYKVTPGVTGIHPTLSFDLERTNPPPPDPDAAPVGGGLVVDPPPTQPEPPRGPAADVFALLATAGWLLGRRAQHELASPVEALLVAGWRPADLVTLWTSSPAANRAGALRYRINDTPPPPPRSGPSRPNEVLTACGHCKAGRWDPPGARVDPDTDTPCPVCLPPAAGVA